MGLPYSDQATVERAHKIVVRRRALMSIVIQADLANAYDGIVGLCPPETLDRAFDSFEDGEAAVFVKSALTELTAAYVDELDDAERIKLAVDLFKRSPDIFRKLLEGI